jgi:hypothetical protein
LKGEVEFMKEFAVFISCKGLALILDASDKSQNVFRKLSFVLELLLGGLELNCAQFVQTDSANFS